MHYSETLDYQWRAFINAVFHASALDGAPTFDRDATWEKIAALVGEENVNNFRWWHIVNIEAAIRAEER